MSNRYGFYPHRPQFETNPSLNEDVTPDVPKFNSNAMDNQGFIPLNNRSNGCCCDHEKAHKEENGHQCSHGKHAENHKHKDCHCDHK